MYRVWLLGSIFQKVMGILNRSMNNPFKIGLRILGTTVGMMTRYIDQYL